MRRYRSDGTLENVPEPSAITIAGKAPWMPADMKGDVAGHEFHGNRFTGGLQVTNYEGEPGNRNHITRNETGHIPTSAIAKLQGARGERPGEHRNMQGEKWDAFKRDVATGMRDPIFITVDPHEAPRISEGNHRRDAAVELGMSHVPVEIRYFGQAEKEGSVVERTRPAAAEWFRPNANERHVGNGWWMDNNAVNSGPRGGNIPVFNLRHESRPDDSLVFERAGLAKDFAQAHPGGTERG